MLVISKFLWKRSRITSFISITVLALTMWSGHFHSILEGEVNIYVSLTFTVLLHPSSLKSLRCFPVIYLIKSNLNCCD